MCLAELNAEPGALAGEIEEPMVAEELALAETEYAELHARIEGMGPINMMALDEFRECEERNGFLSRERDDLVQSIENTQQAIRELDLISREKFEHAFAAINGQFCRGLPHPIRRRHGRNSPDGAGQLRRFRRGHCRATSGKTPAERAAALRRGKSADGAGAC